MSNRYKIVEGSESGHCCFDFSIVDTTRPELDGDGNQINGLFAEVCECFDRESAEMILAALSR